LLRNGSYGTTAGGNGNGTTECLRKQRNSYGAYGILTEFVYNGNGETATERWKLGIRLELA